MVYSFPQKLSHVDSYNCPAKVRHKWDFKIYDEEPNVYEDTELWCQGEPIYLQRQGISGHIEQMQEQGGSKRRRHRPTLLSRECFSPDQPSPTFPFLDLPVELRYEIYRLALRVDKGRITNLPSSSEHPNAIRRVSKQIFNEASCIFYQETRFKLKILDWMSEDPILERLDDLYGLTRVRLALMKKICIQTEVHPRDESDQSTELKIYTYTSLCDEMMENMNGPSLDVEFQFFSNSHREVSPLELSDFDRYMYGVKMLHRYGRNVRVFMHVPVYMMDTVLIEWMRDEFGVNWSVSTTDAIKAAQYLRTFEEVESLCQDLVHDFGVDGAVLTINAAAAKEYEKLSLKAVWSLCQALVIPVTLTPGLKCYGYCFGYPNRPSGVQPVMLDL